MFLFGTGFKGLDPVRSIKERVSAFIIVKIIIQIAKQYFWLWIYVLNQFTVQCLEYTFQSGEIYADS